jgi:hypothetical protein
MRQAKNSTEVLKAVEWILTNVGWTQHSSYRDGYGRTIGGCTDVHLREEHHSSLRSACLSGAVGLVNASDAAKKQAIARLVKAANGKHPMDFNDDDGRTKQQVIDVVRKAARVK